MTKTTNINGKISVLEFALPPSSGIRSLFNPLINAFIYTGIPILGMIGTGGHWNEYALIRNMIIRFPTPEAFLEEMNSAGFVSCDSKDIFLGFVYLFTCDTYNPKHSRDIKNNDPIAEIPAAKRLKRAGLEEVFSI